MKDIHIDLAVCIPSKNESLTISHVTATIDKGLSRYYPEMNCIIINIDSNSNDGTSKTFLDTPTQHRKVSIEAVKKEHTGKGVNLHQFLALASEMNVKCGMVIDADLESIEEEWIHNLGEPILSKKADFVTPLYSRHKFDATITNHLCVPILYGEWEATIHQPIGGEFSFSQKYINSALKALNEIHSQPNPLSTRTDSFGIDIFLTTHAIANNFVIHQSYLGQKIHRFREIRALKSMFMDVAITLFQTITSYRNKKGDLHPIKPPQDPTPPLETSIKIELPALLTLIAEEVGVLSSGASLQYKQLTNLVESRKLNNDNQVLLSINPQEWVRILKDILDRDLSDTYLQEVIEALYPLFLARLVNHFTNIADLNFTQAEHLVKEQIKLMR